jgi:starvation-inducible DNA-binding protein
MSKDAFDADMIMQRLKPAVDQNAHELQPYGQMAKHPIEPSEAACRESVENLNQLLADTMTLRDLYKKHHSQEAGPAFNQLHLLFAKHFGEQVTLVDLIAERIQTLGGVSLAMAPDLAETTLIPRLPQEREAAHVQIARLLHAHEIVLAEARAMGRRAADAGDDDTYDLIVTALVRRNEQQVSFLYKHLVDVPLVRARLLAATPAPDCAGTPLIAMSSAF